MRIAGIALCLCSVAGLASADDLNHLAADFWTWRAVHQPFTDDDIPRIERPADLTPDWSPASMDARRRALTEFEKRWRALDPAAWPVPRQVDYRLMGSALARVRWELDIERGWKRNPAFYVDQTLGAVYDRMLQPPPFSTVRSAEILRRLESIPATIEAAEVNLTEMRRPFAALTIDSLRDVRPRVQKSLGSLKPLLAPEVRSKIDEPAAPGWRLASRPCPRTRRSVATPTSISSAKSR